MPVAVVERFKVLPLQRGLLLVVLEIAAAEEQEGVKR